MSKQLSKFDYFEAARDYVFEIGHLEKNSSGRKASVRRKESST